MNSRTTNWLLGLCLLVTATGCGGGTGSEDQSTQQVSTTQSEVVLAETEIPADSESAATSATTDDKDAEPSGELSDDVDLQTLEMLKVMSDSWKSNPVSQQGEEE